MTIIILPVYNSNVTRFQIQNDNEGFYLYHNSVGGKHPHIKDFSSFEDIYNYCIKHGIAFNMPDEETQNEWLLEGVYYLV